MEVVVLLQRGTEATASAVTLWKGYVDALLQIYAAD